MSQQGVSLKPSRARPERRKLNLSLDAELIKRVKLQAWSSERSVSSIVSRLLEEWLKGEE